MELSSSASRAVRRLQLRFRNMLWLGLPSKLVKLSKLRDTHLDTTIGLSRTIHGPRFFTENVNFAKLGNCSFGPEPILNGQKTRLRYKGSKVVKSSNAKIHLILLFSLLLFPGCLKTRGEVREGEKKKTVQDQVISLQKNTADQGNRFVEVEDELRSLNGRIEVLENRLNQLQGQNDSRNNDDVVKAQDLERKTTLLQDEIVRLNTVVEALNQEVVALKAAATAKIQEPTGEKGSFDLAEDYFKKKDWRKSVLAFQKFRELNPKSKRFPKATLRIGQSFQEMGMKDDAKTFLEEVIAKYPKSDEAKQAKKLLKKK